jgi:sorbitol-specific phosphotransferase system component IIBC
MATSKQPKVVPNVEVGTGTGAGAKAFKSRVACAGSIRTGDYPEMKTSGIKVRGTGAATKGLLARGPMA